MSFGILFGRLAIGWANAPFGCIRARARRYFQHFSFGWCVSGASSTLGTVPSLSGFVAAFVCIFLGTPRKSRSRQINCHVLDWNGKKLAKHRVATDKDTCATVSKQRRHAHRHCVPSNNVKCRLTILMVSWLEQSITNHGKEKYTSHAHTHQRSHHFRNRFNQFRWHHLSSSIRLSAVYFTGMHNNARNSTQTSSSAGKIKTAHSMRPVDALWLAVNCVFAMKIVFFLFHRQILSSKRIEKRVK